MIEVTYDETPLSDQRKVQAIIKRLGVPPLPPKALPNRSAEKELPAKIADIPIAPLQFWERYLINRRPCFTWHGKKEVWLTAHADAGVLRRVVVSGLTAKKDAEALRSEAWCFQQETGKTLTVDDIRRIANDVASNRPEREYRDLFAQCLGDVRRYFKWQDGKIIESDGRILPINRMGLRPKDVDILRAVFAALPRTLINPISDGHGENFRPLKINDAPCPLCGDRSKAVTKKKESPLKHLKNARKDIADEAFTAWVNARLTDENKPGVWTRPRPLYDDYVNWIGTRRDNQSKTDHDEVRATTLSIVSVGILLGRMYAVRRDRNNKFYNVRLKKRGRTTKVDVLL